VLKLDAVAISACAHAEDAQRRGRDDSSELAHAARGSCVLDDQRCAVPVPQLFRFMKSRQRLSGNRMCTRLLAQTRQERSLLSCTPGANAGF
jgi:hypothetical protein